MAGDRSKAADKESVSNPEHIRFASATTLTGKGGYAGRMADSPSQTHTTPASRAHLVQLDITWEDKPANFRKLERLLDDADPSPGDLVLLPEMFDTGFSFNLAKTADADGETLKFLQTLAADLGVTIQGGRTVHPCHCDKAHNRAPIIGPTGEPITEYTKIQPFTYGKEAEFFTGGREVITYPWQGLAACPAICYDLRFPEIFRAGLAKGAELFAIGANWPEARAAHWRALLLARAIENQAFVLGVNRTGRDPTLAYAGGSIALGPRGEVLGELDAREGVLSVTISPALVRDWRATFPAWRDRANVVASLNA